MKRLFFLLFITLQISLYGQDFYHMAGKTVTLSNGYITREICLDHDSVNGTILSIPEEQRNFIHPGREFSFLLNGKTMDGCSGWTFIACRTSEYRGCG